MTCFRGWKRKLSVVVLLVTCGLSAIWIRSQNQADAIHLTILDFRLNLISGGAGFTALPGISRFEFFPETVEDSSGIRTTLVFVPAFPLAGDLPAFEWRSAAGSNIRVQSPPPDMNKVTMTPYWAIVLPLTTIFAWLLLSKPRLTKPIESPATRANSRGEHG